MFCRKDPENRDFFRRQGACAPVVTRAAERGSPLAIQVCNEAASNILDGIRLVGRMFPEHEVDVVLIGSCVRSPFLRNAVRSQLTAMPERNYRIVEPSYLPMVGAVLMALEQEQIVLSRDAMDRLRDLPTQH